VVIKYQITLLLQTGRIGCVYVASLMYIIDSHPVRYHSRDRLT